MLYYDRIDISKIIDSDKSNNRKECMDCYHWFLNHELELTANAKPDKYYFLDIELDSINVVFFLFWILIRVQILFLL